MNPSDVGKLISEFDVEARRLEDECPSEIDIFYTVKLRCRIVELICSLGEVPSEYDGYLEKHGYSLDPIMERIERIDKKIPRSDISKYIVKSTDRF
ncbi:hypothetical protein ACFL1H_06650 [Nanoarchaeota archaeon]